MADRHQRREVHLRPSDDSRDGAGLDAGGADHDVVEGEVVGWVGFEGSFLGGESGSRLASGSPPSPAHISRLAQLVSILRSADKGGPQMGSCCLTKRRGRRNSPPSHKLGDPLITNTPRQHALHARQLPLLGREYLLDEARAARRVRQHARDARDAADVCAQR